MGMCGVCVSSWFSKDRPRVPLTEVPEQLRSQRAVLSRKGAAVMAESGH